MKIKLENKRKINSIQYKSLRLAYKQPLKTKNQDLLELSNTVNIEDRIIELNKRYLNNCMRHKNEQIIDLIQCNILSL